MLGRHEFNFDKIRVDLAFEHAWSSLPIEYRAKFPQVATDLRNGTDATWVMAHADKGKRVTPLFWEWSGGQLSIYQRGEGWDSSVPRDVEYALSMVDGDVPLDGWIALANEFLVNYEKSDQR